MYATGLVCDLNFIISKYQVSNFPPCPTHCMSYTDGSSNRYVMVVTVRALAYATVTTCIGII